MGEVSLSQIWHLRGLSESTDRWYFTANYKLDLENSLLRNRLQGETEPPLSLDDFEPNADKIRVLVQEVRGRLEGIEEIAEGEFALGVARRLDRLMRKPRQSGRETRLICVADVLDSAGTKVSEHQMEIELDDLSAGARGAVRRLDLRALEECHLILVKKSQALDGAPTDLLVTPRKIPLFIAYRRTQVETAKRLHGILQGIGRGTIFDPYLDLHDMQSGTWKDQLFERIESTGLFMPLVSDDYGEADSVSREEYEYAKGVAADREGQAYFVPIVIGDTETEIKKELLKFDAHVVASGEEVELQRGELHSWLGRVAEAGSRNLTND